MKIIGVEPADANAMALSLHHGQRVVLDQVGGFADGVAVKMVGEETFRLSRNLMDGVVLVSRDSICAAIKVMAMIQQTCCMDKNLGGALGFHFSHFLFIHMQFFDVANYVNLNRICLKRRGVYWNQLEHWLWQEQNPTVSTMVWRMRLWWPSLVVPT